VDAATATKPPRVKSDIESTLPEALCVN
jgi:hypothetical protein